MVMNRVLSKSLLCLTTGKVQNLCRMCNFHYLRLTGLNQTNKQYRQQRYYSGDSPSKWSLFRLDSRGIISVKGKDAVLFLQGLVTNDVNLIGDNCKAIYTFLLNKKGRVHNDLILYHSPEPWTDEEGQHILVECDSIVMDLLIETFQIYKIRRKVNFANVSENIKVFAALPPEGADNSDPPINPKGLDLLVQDPRVSSFSWRILAKDQETVEKSLTGAADFEEERNYHIRRYKYGVGEGLDDFAPGHLLALAANADLYNTVSSNKGCYIGQEVTARTQTTAVVRTRVVPIEFESDKEESDNERIAHRSEIYNDEGKFVGVYLSRVGQYGMAKIQGKNRFSGALLTIIDDLDSTNIKKAKITTFVPPWWPEYLQPKKEE